MTLNEWGRDVVQEMRQIIAPGASGWDAGAESTSLRTLAHQAQINIDFPDPLSQLGIDVRNEVMFRIISEMAPGYVTGGFQERDIETGANAGQVNSALIGSETYFINTIAEEA